MYCNWQRWQYSSVELIFNNIHCVQEKKRPKCFFVISLTKLGQLWWNLVHSFLNKFAAKPCERFPTHWIVSLHYLVKLEMLIAHVLQLSCKIEKLQNLSNINCGLQIHQIWIQLITVCGKYCKRATMICSYRRRHWRIAAAMTTWSSSVHFILS